MARRRQAQIKESMPDPVFHDITMAKFINNIMFDGKKTVAQKIFYKALEDASRMVNNTDQKAVFSRVMENVRPVVEVRSRRVGGATYQVPVEVPPNRQDALAMRWIIGFSRMKKGTPMGKALAQEFADAYNEQGSAIRRRDEMHRMAEANRAFAHYRW